MPVMFQDLVERSYSSELPVIEGKQLTLETLKANAKILEKLMSTNGSSIGMPRISMKEALTSADASILFRKVINDTLIRPVEPNMVFSSRLAKIITVDNARSVVFPTIGAIRAAEVSETGDYPEAHPGFAEMSTEIKVSKYGLTVPVGQDIIDDSQWDVIALFLEAARFAMARLKEEKCANEFATNSTRVFDNKYNQTTLSSQFTAQTTGRNVTGGFNGTMSFKDVIDTLGRLVSNEYSPTDITVHPMMWSVFAKDPILSFLMLQNGQATQTVSSLGPDAIKSNLPWAFNVNVSPFVSYNVTDTLKIAQNASDDTGISVTGPTTDLYISDRNNSLVILQRDALSVDEFDEPYRDIHRIRCKERFGVNNLNNGMSVTSIKNIVIDDNSEPVYTIRTITGA